MKDKYLRETRMVDFSNPAIQKLIQNMKWKEMGEFERIKAIYNYVRDDVLFGYNIDDGISASKVLADGYGQCNTKGTLFMALLRACNIKCTLCQGHYDFFLFRFLLYICLLCRGIKVMPLIDCFHLLL